MYARCIHALFALIIGLSSCYLSGAMIDDFGGLGGRADMYTPRLEITPGMQNIYQLERLLPILTKAQEKAKRSEKALQEALLEEESTQSENATARDKKRLSDATSKQHLKTRRDTIQAAIERLQTKITSGGADQNMITTIRDIEKLQELELDTESLIAKKPTSKELRAVSEHDKDVTGRLEDLVRNARTLDDPTARAIISGIAGNQAKSLTGISVDTWYKGLGYGVTFAVAQGAGNAIQNSVKLATGRIIGEPIEACAGKVMEWLTALYYNLVHNGVRPYDTKKILGTSNLINVTFEDLAAMLRDGLKDVSRAADVTLRSLDDNQDTKKRQTGWSMLIGGYIRQFDIIMGELDRNVEHYPEDSTVVIYVHEIKERVFEVKQLLAASKTIRELDDLIDANKGLITALRKNIKNLFDRLVEQIDPGKKVTMMSTSEPSRNKGYGKYDDDDAFPHAYAGA